MAPSRVVRIDDDVWAELQRRAVPFEDNPNSVLRRILGLAAREPIRDHSRSDDIESRVKKLVALVGKVDGRHLKVEFLRSEYYGIRFEGGIRFGFIYPQRKRLKVEIRRDWAEKSGYTEKDWEHKLTNGFFPSGIDSVYWYVPNENQAKYDYVAEIIGRLGRLGT
ncbi:hypothetical protein ACFLXV_03660 [Chloroflexota bacterium]